MDARLHASEERYRALVTASAQLVWSTPPDGLVVDMPAWRAYTGQSVEEVAGWGWLDAISPEDRASTQVAWSQALATGTVYETEYRLRRYDGVYRDFLVRGIPVLRKDATTEEWVGFCTDITERKQLEAAQRLAAEAAEARARELEATFEAIADAVFIYDDQGNIVQMNSAGRSMLGLESAPEHESLSLEERAERYQIRDEHGVLFTSDQRLIVAALAGEVSAGASAHDVVITTLDGRTLNLNFSSAPIRSSEGRVVGAVGIFRDVTERRHLEQYTHEAVNALLAMAEAVVSVDTIRSEGPSAPVAAKRLVQLVRRVLNCARVSIYAIEGETDIAHPIAVEGLSPDHERDWEADQSAQSLPLRDWLGPELLTQLTSGEVLVLDAGRSPLAVSPNWYGITTLLLAPMRTGERLIGLLALDNGEVARTFSPPDIALAGGVAKLAALVLERDRLLRERAQSQAHALVLHEANRRMDEFMGIAGHELRTPLTSIKANIQLAARRARRIAASSAAGEPVADLPEQMDALVDLLERADRQAELQNRLVSDLLDVSRIQSDTMELRPERCDLSAIVARAVEEQRTVWPERAITVALPPEGVAMVEADVDRIGQVTTNYLTNALKYSANEQPIEVRLTVQGAGARLTVRDFGPGLPPEQHTLIWERFHRAPGVREVRGASAGLGLGLHISKSLIVSQGGQVGVESVPGQGSTFWFTLPLSPERSTGE